MVAKLLEAPHYEDGPPQPAANGTAGEDGSISIPIERQAHALRHRVEYDRPFSIAARCYAILRSTLRNNRMEVFTSVSNGVARHGGPAPGMCPDRPPKTMERCCDGFSDQK
jgi:hypothetical protein